MRQKFPQKVMVWLGVCSKGVTPSVILGQGTVDHIEYIEKVLPIALNIEMILLKNTGHFNRAV